MRACPVEFDRIDETTARCCAWVTLAVLTLYLATPARWLALFLAADFYLRGFGREHLSPQRALSLGVRRALGLGPRPVDAGPKRFAAQLGFLFSLVLTALWLADAPLAGTLVGAGFALAVAGEAFFGFCLACQLYAYLGR